MTFELPHHPVVFCGCITWSENIAEQFLRLFKSITIITLGCHGEIRSLSVADFHLNLSQNSQDQAKTPENMVVRVPSRFSLVPRSRKADTP
jgi:hypothetical protein